MKNLARALLFFRPDLPRLGFVFVLIFGNLGANLLKPWPLALIVDCVLSGKPWPGWLTGELGAASKTASLIILSGILLLLHLGQGAIAAAQNYLSIQIGLRGLMRVRNEVFACLQRLSLRFHRGSQSGDVIYRASWDTYSFQTLFQQGLITLVTAVLALALMVAVMWRVNAGLTLVAVGSVPALVLAIRIFAKAMQERGVAAQQADSRVTSLVQQTIAALPVIQSYTREAQEQRKFTAQTAQAQSQRLAQHGWELLYGLAIAVVFGLGTAAIVWFGSHQVLAGKLTVGQLLIFLAYLGQLYEPLNQLTHVGATLSTASAGTQRVFEILDTPEEVKDAPDARPVVRGVSCVEGTKPTISRDSDRASRITHHPPLLLRGQITFDHVSFAYQKDQPVLQDIYFTLAAGQSAAIIGPSGVGKTTLLNLLPRFADPTGGAVRLDGVDLRELRLKDLRAHIALVLQEPILLSTTIAENIGYGKPGASASEIEAAARAANADTFIQKLSQRYDTIVGEGASQLSAGEKQRLNLARAFLKDAPILLLDEPTSALDAESEALVVASLHQLMRGRTTLIVAHRLSTIGRVDKILSLEDGRITEMGSPDELRQREGYYARIVSGQTELG